MTNVIMDLSIIIVSYNTKETLRDCLHKITYSDNILKREIIIVDNDSKDGSVEMLKDNFPGVVLIENKKNEGFARANIKGVKIAQGKYVLLVNPDSLIEKDSILKTINFMEQNSQYGILGCRLVNKNGELEPSARYFPTPWRLFLLYSGIGSLSPGISFLRGIDNMLWPHDSVREIDWVPGCYFLIRKKVIEEIGFFDPLFYMYYEEIDFCFRAKKKGWKVAFYPDAKIIHIGGESAKVAGEITKYGKQLEMLRLQSEFIYFRKNCGVLYVFLDFFFIALLDFIRIIKKAIFLRRSKNISDNLRHIALASSLLGLTGFGTRSRN